MKKWSLCVWAILLWLPLHAQDERIVRAALYLSGASCEEEIPSDWLERLEAARPLHVNSPYLRPGVLLSDYQVACIRDYRASGGDILSPEELALVDGFSQEAVAALRPFLLFDSARLPGNVDTVRVHGSALVRKTLTTLGAKAKVSGENWRAGGAWRGEDWTVYGEGTFRRWRVLTGDFHTRWGQGLAAWTGFSMESLSTLDAFLKRSTGLSPSGSYSSANSLRGGAVEYDGGRFRGAIFGGRGFAGARADYRWRRGQMGFTWLSGGTYALDGRCNLRGVDLAGELALRGGAFAFQLASGGKMGEYWKWAAQGRYIPSRYSGRKYGEYALAAGWGFRNHYGDSPGHEFSLTADAALVPIPGSDPRRFQLRSYGIWKWQITPLWLLDVRITERYRNYEAPRTDFRSDIRFGGAGPWLSTLRLEAVLCDGWGLLSYLEGGYKGDALSAWLRLTGFSVSAWAARIYCYEREAPGNFSVPAYNGRGLAPSLVAGYKLRIGHRFTLRAHLRAACTLRTDRAPAYTLNLQLQGEW